MKPPSASRDDDTAAFVSDMCASIQSMKLTPTKREFAKAVMRAAINFANEKRSKSAHHEQHEL